MIKIRNITFFGLISVSQTLRGITSKIQDNEHLVMWDLDRCTLEQAEETLQYVQRKYQLSTIFIYSDKPTSYRAICFTRVDFKTLLRIILDTCYVDYDFFHWTVYRGKATLRLSGKQGRPLQKVVSILATYEQPIPEQLEEVIYDTGVDKTGIMVYKRM